MSAKLLSVKGWKSCLPTSSILNVILICTGIPGIVPRGYPYPEYCAEGLTELTEVQGTGIKPFQNSQKFRAGTKTWYRYPGYCGTGRIELTEVPGTGIKVLQNLQKISVGYFPGKYPGYGSVGTLQNHNFVIVKSPSNSSIVLLLFVAVENILKSEPLPFLDTKNCSPKTYANGTAKLQ